jgi:hypothetical protein
MRRVRLLRTIAANAKSFIRYFADKFFDIRDFGRVSRVTFSFHETGGRGIPQDLGRKKNFGNEEQRR